MENTNNEAIKKELENIFEIPSFDYFKFKEEINSGDLNGLDYLEKTLIRDYKDRINDNVDKYTWYDYIISLFYATRELNECLFMQQQTSVKNNFNSDIYFETRDLLCKELGFDLEDLWR